MPYHEDQLPELAPPQQARKLSEILNQQLPLMDDLSMSRKGIQYAPDGHPLQYMLNHKGLKAHGLLGPMEIDGQLRYGGDWSLNGHMPLFGGLLNLGASRNEGNDAYQLQYQRSFR